MLRAERNPFKLKGEEEASLHSCLSKTEASSVPNP